MVRSLNAAFIAILLAFCSVVTNADTKAPEIIPEPAIPAVLKELSPLDFKVKDDFDLEPDLIDYSLKGSDGSEVPGVSADWGKRCPQGFTPVDETTCRKITLTPKKASCQPDFDRTTGIDGIEVCQQVQTTPVISSCPENYTLDEDGENCFKTEIKDADPACDKGWTLVGEQCEIVITEPATTSCPDGYERNGNSCEKTITEEASQACPGGEEPVDGMCSTIEYAPAVVLCKPGGTPKKGIYDTWQCMYPAGVVEADYTPRKVVECRSGYQTTDNQCFKTVKPRGCRWGTLKSKGQGSWACEYPAKVIRSSGGVMGPMDINYCRNDSGQWKDGNMFQPDICSKGRGHFKCSSGYSGKYSKCEANRHSSAGVKSVKYNCSYHVYKNGKCWKKSEAAKPECKESEQNPETVSEKCVVNQWSGKETCSDVWDTESDEACMTGGSSPQGTTCAAGFDFDGTNASCGSETVTDASDSCPSGYTKTGSACIKEEQVEGEISCPPGFELDGNQCIREKSKPPAQCPQYYSREGDLCVKKTVVEPEKTYSCPTSTIPQYCSFNGMATQWMGNFGDEALSVSDQQTACANYTKGSVPGVLSPISSSTQCSTPFKQTSGPGHHCSNTGNKICATTTAAKHRLSWGNDAQSIGLNLTCSAGYSLQAGACVKHDQIEVCPQGWSLQGGQCILIETMDMEVSCPSGFYADNKTCRYTDVVNVDYSCPDGQELKRKKCVESIVTDSWTEGEGCPSGSTVIGGECTRTDVTTESLGCPAGFTLSGNSCVRTEIEDPNLVCGDSSWNLQATTCWKTLTEAKFEECPSGDWVIEGSQCKQVITDTVIRECPEGYDVSNTNNDECIKEEVAANRQNNSLAVSLPKVWPGSYTLNLSVKDDAGNVGSEEFNINYAPDLLSLRGGEAKLSMPAVQHAFKWEDGAATLVTQPITIGKSVLSGGRPVYAGVSAQATTGYNFSGVTVEPGEYKEIIPSYDFDKTKGTLELPMYPLSGEASTSDIVVSVGGDGGIASVIEVTAWTFSGEAVPSQNPVMQLFQELVVEAGVSEETPCSLTGQPVTAKAASVLDNPYCLIEWTTIPAPLTEQGRVPKLEGKFDYEGTKEAGFSAYLVDSEGERIKVGEGTTSFGVKEAFGAFDWQFQNDVSPILHTVEELNGRLQQVSGPNCRLTVDEDKAIDYAQRGYVGHLCYLKWFDLPGTFDQAPNTSRPLLQGRVYSAGHYDLGYRVFAYTRLGVPVMISEQTASIEAIDPPPPRVDFINGKKINDSLYEGNITGDRLASAHIQSKNADLTVTHLAGSELIDERDFPSSPWSSEFSTYQRVKSVATKLWERNTHTVTARYADLQAISASKSIETLAVPDEDIGPTLVSDAEYVLNDDTIPLAIRIGNLYRADVDYDPELMGEWEVRTVRQVSYGEYEPVTDWVDHDSEGYARMSLDLEELGVREGYVRIYAEARVKSPAPDFSRTKRSTRPLFLKVLFGGAIDANINGDQMSGPVPFRGVFRLGLNDRGLIRALGDVQWQISEDDGATWTDRENRARNNQYLDMTFEEPGSYLVRAKLKNRNSSVATQTPPVEVIAYRKPEVIVDWKTDVFVGEEIILDSTVTLNGVEVGAEDVDIEWSNDAGDTFEPGGLKHTFERTTDPESSRKERWEVRVKAPNAPADDPMAWTVREGSINYQGIRGPRIYIRGPRILELGNTYKFNVYRAMPYLRMEYDIDGYFTMPDGTKVYGDTVMYTPTEEDLEERYIKLHYTGWIVGWKEAGAVNTDDQGVRIWEYEFPEFAINGRYSANVVPVEATLYTRPRTRSGRLEEPVYEWDIPESFEIIEDINPIARRVIIHEPGKFDINVKVTDARMNEGYATETIEVGVPEDYDLNMRLTGSNEYNRAPYEIVARPDIDGGHPRDRVEEYNYTVNGEPMELFGRYGRAILEAGDHTVRLEILSEFGKVGAVEEVVSVFENKPPVCNLEVRDGTFRFTVRNRCDDPDGRVRNYNWWIDGEPLNLTGYQVSITKKESGKELLIEGEGIDASGLISDREEVRIQMPDPKPEQPNT